MFSHNSYFLGIFACCRETYKANKMKDCVQAPEHEFFNILYTVEEEEEHTLSEVSGGHVLNFTGHADRQKYCLIWGCRPGTQVLADTNMVKEISDVMKERFDRNTLSLRIPQAFDQLKSKDAEFEMVTSNLLQPLAIFFKDKIVTESMAAIFVNTHCRTIPYNKAKELG